MLNYSAAVRVYDELLLDLIRKGVSIPAAAVEDLKAGRSLISIAGRQPAGANADAEADIEVKIASVLQNVETALLSLAEICMDAGYAEAWQQRFLAGIREEPADARPASAATFVAGVPKGEHWARIKADELAGITVLDALLKEHMLSSAVQDGGWLLVHGRKADVVAFLKTLKQTNGH